MMKLSLGVGGGVDDAANLFGTVGLPGHEEDQLRHLSRQGARRRPVALAA
jgi:hypothetical protein